MQMQAMNFGRGFGGQPQPQRQGGRRGMNRGPGGGFRNTRFDNNPNHNQQRNFNQGHRPNENNKPKPNLQQQAQNQPAKPAQQQQQAVSTPPKPAQPQVQPPAVQQPKQQTPVKPAGQDKVDTVKVDSTPPANFKAQNQTPNRSQTQAPTQAQTAQNQGGPKPANQNQGGPNNQNQFQKNVNGNFGGNKQGGTWAQGSGPRQSLGGQNQGGNQIQGGNQGGPNRPRMSMGGQGGPQGQRRGPGGPRPGGHMHDGPQREENMLAHKLKDLVGPVLDLPPLDTTEVKFNGRSRLYIGNLHSDATEEEINNLFGQYGETAELFMNKEKNFGFIKMDYRMNAEKAKRELDGMMKNGRQMRVRFAPHNNAVRVKNIPPFVTNELLYRSFEIFGKIERAFVRVDERGKPLGEGVVEYSRKPSALAAIRNCSERCFFLTSSLRPVIVETLEEPDEYDGYPEKNLPRKHPELLRAREVGPRFSEATSFEHEYGTRWKQLYELHKQKEDALKKELAAEEEKLEAQMEYAKYEHETEMLRAALRQREQDRERQKRSWEMAERAADERRDCDRAALQRSEEQLAQRMRAQDDELRRRQQENTLFVQAQRLNSMLDRQEQGMFNSSPMDGGFRDDYGRGDMQQNRAWDGHRQDDFQNKRRRF